MAPPTTSEQQQQQQPLQEVPRRQGHRRRTDLEAPLAPLFSPCWAFEVEGAQLRRVLGHCLDKGQGQDGDEGLVAGCLEDRRRQQASGLVAATGRVDLLRVPEAHRRYISRVFWIPHACRDLGWLAFSPDVRRAVKEARSAVAVAAVSARKGGEEEEPMRFCLKMSAFPKSLEYTAGEVLLEGGYIDESELSPSASQASHVLHICHCPGWSPLFYYGLTRSVRFEEWLAARGLTPPPAEPDNDPSKGPAGVVRVGPAVESAAYRVASSRDKEEKERAKALIQVDKALSQDGDGWREGAPLPPVSRAYFKMKEIVEDGHLHHLGLGQRAWANARALDVGAAPGGWTQYLSEHVAGLERVLAVDGGKLHPGVLARPAVRYAGCRIQDEAARAAMVVEGPFAIVASDVNLYPEEMAELIAAHVVPHLACGAERGQGALLALTLKFPGKPTPEREASSEGRVVRILGEGGKRMGMAVAAHRCVWLHANSANERTLLAVVVRVGRGGGGE